MHEIFALVCDIYSFRQRAKIVDACIAEHANPLHIVDVERGGSFILDHFDSGFRIDPVAESHCGNVIPFAVFVFISETPFRHLKQIVAGGLEGLVERESHLACAVGHFEGCDRLFGVFVHEYDGLHRVSLDKFPCISRAKF